MSIVVSDYLSGETSETFSLERYLAKFDPRLLETSEGRRIATRLDPLLFALLYMPHHLRSEQTGGKITLSDFHLNLLRQGRDWLLPLDVPKKYRDVYIAPRDAGKTTWLYGVLPLWAAAHRHYTFIAAFSDSGAQAEQHLASFRNELENNTLLQIDHPSLCTPKRRDGGVPVANNANQIYQRNEFTFIAKGIDSGALGMKVDTRRPQLIILDDIERGEGTYTPYQAEMRLKTVLDTVLPMNIFARIIIVGTVTMNGSIIHQMVKKAIEPSEDDPSWIEEENFKIHYHAPIISEDDGRERSMWPTRWPLDFLKSIQHTRSYKKNFENLPVSTDTEYWDDDDFQYGDLHTSKTGLFIDPATTSKKSSDFTGLAVVGMSPPTESFRLRRCLLKWAKAVKLPPDKLRDLVIQTLNDFPEIGVVVVEVNQGGDLWYTALHNLPVKLKVITVSEPKDQRASRLLSQYERNRVMHLKRFPNVENQMISYPNSVNDDLIDAVGMGVTYYLGTGKRSSGRPGIIGNVNYS